MTGVRLKEYWTEFPIIYIRESVKRNVGTVSFFLSFEKLDQKDQKCRVKEKEGLKKFLKEQSFEKTEKFLEKLK